MKKIKVIEFVDAWTPGGVENNIIQLIRNIDREKFDPIVWTTQKKTNIYDQNLFDNDIKLEVMRGVNCKNPILRIIQSLSKFNGYLINEQCDVFHLHASNGAVLVYAFLAKKSKIEKVIVHSHSTDYGDGQRVIKWIGHQLGKLLFLRYVDEKIACSDKAASWLFTKKQILNGNVKIIESFVDTGKFMYSKSVRDEYRDKYKLDKEYVFLNVGRFHYQKNQLFLLRTFKIISDSIPSKLFVIGEGDLEEELRKETQKLELNSKVVFVGTTTDVEKYMWMADGFILTSLYEGNPITVTEAQAAGLPCYISDKITRTAKLVNSTNFISIDSPAQCAEMIKGNLINNDDNERKECNRCVYNSGYNLISLVKKFEDLYSK